MRLLITGGAGFIGSHFIKHWLINHSSDIILNLDLLTYAGNTSNLKDIKQNFPQRYCFQKGDVTDPKTVETAFESFKPQKVIHFAAESHNSRAIVNPTRTTHTNVIGTQLTLEASRKYQAELYLLVSTCEVYGDLTLTSTKKFKETSPCQPRTPYNASKAAADLIALSYYNAFGTPIIISRCSNNYGPFQHPEKVIPLFIINAIKRIPLPIYEHNLNKREWVHVEDHYKALETLITQGIIGNIYNIGSGIEITVEDLANNILNKLKLPSSFKKYIPDRPGHDRRYLLNCSKIHHLGWRPRIDFNKGITETVKWYQENEWWWQSQKQSSKLP